MAKVSLRLELSPRDDARAMELMAKIAVLLRAEGLEITTIKEV